MKLLSRLVMAVIFAVAVVPAIGGHARVDAASFEVPATLTIHAPTHLANLKSYLAEQFPAVEDFVGERLGDRFHGPVTVHLASDTAHVGRIFAEMWGRDEPVPVPDGFAGWAVPSKAVIVLNTHAYGKGSIFESALTTLRHEYCHLVMGQWAVRAGRPWPTWFEEGVCQFVERSLAVPNPITVAVSSGTIETPSLADLSRMIEARGGQTPEGYALSEDAVRTLLGRISRPSAAKTLQALAEKFAETHGDFDAAFMAVFGESVGGFEARWQTEANPGGLTAVLNFFGAHAGELIFGSLGLILALGLFVRRQRNRRLLAEMPD